MQSAPDFKRPAQLKLPDISPKGHRAQYRKYFTQLIPFPPSQVERGGLEHVENPSQELEWMVGVTRYPWWSR